MFDDYELLLLDIAENDWHTRRRVRGVSPSLPEVVNGYITEDKAHFYVTENSSSIYVTEF